MSSIRLLFHYFLPLHCDEALKKNLFVMKPCPHLIVSAEMRIKASLKPKSCLMNLYAIEVIRVYYLLSFYLPILKEYSQGLFISKL